MAAKLQVIDTGMATANTDRQKALDAALAQIDRAFGKGSAMKLGSREAMQVEAISSGSLGLDIAFGVGGLQRSRAHIRVAFKHFSGKQLKRGAGIGPGLISAHDLTFRLGLRCGRDVRPSISASGKGSSIFLSCDWRHESEPPSP